MSEQPISPADEALLKQNILKSQAVRQAMVEVIAEQRVEILKRARAKLVSMGIELAVEDLDAQV